MGWARSNPLYDAGVADAPLARLLKWARSNLFYIAVIGITVWLVAAPLALLVLNSFRQGHPLKPGDFTLANFISGYSSPAAYQTFANSFILAVAGTAITLCIGVLFAWFVERTDMPLRSLAWALILIPMALPGLIFAIAWTWLLGERAGLINIYLRGFLSLFGLNLTTGPFNIYSLGGMIFLDGLRGVTTVFLLLVGAFRAMDPGLEEAARMSGASARRILHGITLPLLMPAVFAAFMYSFMSSLESLEIPMILGLPSRTFVFSSYIFFVSQRQLPADYGLAAALSMSFLAISVGLLYFYHRATRIGQRFATITGKGYRPHRLSLGRWRFAALGCFSVYFLFAILLPLAMLVWASLLPFYRRPSLEALPTLTLKNYATVLGMGRFTQALWNTTMVSLLTATAVLLLALCIAWIVMRARVRGHRFLDMFTFLPHAIPGVVVGIALIYLYLQPPIRYLNMYGTVWIVIVGLVITFLPFSARIMNAAITQIHPELEEAARLSGAGLLRMLLGITLRLIVPAFIAGWVWVIAHALRVFSIPLMLGSKENVVIAVFLWDLWQDGQPMATAALSVMFVVVMLIIVLLSRRYFARLGTRGS